MLAKYYVSGVVNGILYEDNFNAVSAKQAWYFFGKKFGFKYLRDFKVLLVIEEAS